MDAPGFKKKTAWKECDRTLEGSSGSQGEAFGTPSGTRLVAGLIGRSWLGGPGAGGSPGVGGSGGRRAGQPSPRGVRSEPGGWSASSARGRRPGGFRRQASLGPDTLGVGGGGGAGASKVPGPAAAAPAPSGSARQAPSSVREAREGGLRAGGGSVPSARSSRVPATSLLARSPGRVGRGVL
ncbi:PE-PGRS family protein PE_PGRS61-like [Odocoileus virginianus]|uniref:PE-PGRS family protein PE_PGRS61-like n=1 Tax=Odocoileus virginianus TaxID=9874 RepID=A0ABM4IYU4_ODOVR